ncbi:2OG-Fe(II) oxygenase [Pseudomonas sp. GM84]|uniref:2OG-Fe(II) oxygenase n=1 Tax=Pseudomonas sp. GM84 TaxID=1144340 RepID=UPI0009DA2A1C|nr:2OG-Fe(II) oxygenase [Pseudomonas sp. GM84]
MKAEQIEIIDEAISSDEQDQITHALSNATWRLDWPINSTPFARPCWHFFIAGSKRSSFESCEEELINNNEWAFLAAIWQRLKDKKLKNTTLLGVYANGQTFGQDSPIHRDNRASKPGKTAVLFCNDYWSISWGGELILFNESKKDIIHSIPPRSGRIVIFDGQIPHRARSPAIDCTQLRTTIAFKTINKEA